MSCKTLFCILDIVYSFDFYLRLHLHYNRFFGSVAYTSSQTVPNGNKMPLLLELNVHVYTDKYIYVANKQ